MAPVTKAGCPETRAAAAFCWSAESTLEVRPEPRLMPSYKEAGDRLFMPPLGIPVQTRKRAVSKVPTAK